MKSVIPMGVNGHSNGHVNGHSNGHGGNGKVINQPEKVFTSPTYLPPPPEEILIVDQSNPVPIPPVETFLMLEKIINQAVRIWPACSERGYLAVNELRSIFYDVNGRPKKLCYSKVL